MKTFKIDYCNGFFLTIEAENLKEAAQKAMESAAHTQCDIKIRNERYETIAIAKWYGVPPEDWDQPILEIGGGFYDEFQNTQYFEYI